jgi:hypothetical protein
MAAAVTGLAALATFAPTLADRPAATAFDPLFTNGASCAPPPGGRPALLVGASLRPCKAQQRNEAGAGQGQQDSMRFHGALLSPP